MIEARSLVRRYGDFAAVDHVDFKIEPGEVVGLLGHNGAGKTTIMKMLTGFIEPSAGQVLVNGLDVQTHALEVQASLGYLPESLPIYPELSVAEYLGYAAALRGVAVPEAVREAIAATDLGGKAFDKVATLSRGFKQRVGVAQAILHRPKFLILDEPSNGLDPQQIHQMRALIRSLAETSTVILSTHIMQEVDAVCDRTIILRNGRIAVDARLDQLRETSVIDIETTPEVQLEPIIGELGELSSDAQTPGHYQLAVAQEVGAVAAEAARRMVAAQAPIFRINQRVRDLESIFREVNDPAQGAGEEASHAA